MNNEKIKKALAQLSIIVAAAIILGSVVNILRPDSIPFAGDWSEEARLKTPEGKNIGISLSEASLVFKRKKAVFIDARSMDDYEKGHIRGAVSLPWEKVDDRFSQVADFLPQGAMIITYCDGKTCDLSRELALFLLEMGYENVHVLPNGWSSWEKSNLPVDSSDKP